MDVYVTRSQMIDMLKRHPSGLTANTAAELLGIRQQTAASRLSKLASYNLASRIPVPSRVGHGRQYLYRFLAPVPLPAEREPTSAEIDDMRKHNRCAALASNAEKLSIQEIAQS